MAAKVEVNLLTDINQSLKSIERFQKSANQSLKSVQNSSVQVSKSAGLVAEGMASARTAILGVGAAFASLAAIREVTGAFIDFNKAIGEVTTISKEATENQAALTEQLVDVSAQFGTDAASQAKTFYQIISSGITDSAQANEFLIATNKLAIGGLAGTDESIRILAASVNAFGKENISASRAADILFGTVKLGVTNVSQLAGSLGQVLPSARALGVSFEDVSGAVAALTTRGITTSRAVTQLNAVFTAVLSNQARAKTILGENADAFSLQALKTKDLSVFLRDLNNALGGSAVKLRELLGRSEAVNGVLALSSDNFETLASNSEKLANSLGSADEAFEKIRNTIGQQLSEIRAQASAIAIKFFISNQDTILDFLKGVNEFLNGIRTGAPETIAQLRQFGAVLTSALIVFQGGAIASAASSFFTTIISGAGAARIAVIGLNTAIAAGKVAATFGLSFVIDAVFELAGAFSVARENGEGFLSSIGSFFEALGLKISNLGIAINNVFLEAIQGIFEQASQLPVIGDQFAGVGDKFADALKRGEDQIKTNTKELNKLLGVAKEVEKTGGAAAGAGTAGAAGSGAGTGGTGGGQAGASGGAVGAAVAAGVFAGLQQGGERGAIAVANSISKTLPPQLQGFVQAATAAAQFLSQGADRVRTQLESVLNSVDSLLVKIIDGGLAAVDVIIDRFDDVAIAIINRIPEILERISESLPESLAKAAASPVVSIAIARAFVRAVPRAAVAFANALVTDGAPRFVDALIKEISGQNLGGQASGSIPGGFSLPGIPGFATGLDRVPSGFSDDSFTARLSSNEGVFTSAQSNRMDQILAMAEQGGGSGRPIQVNQTIQIGEQELATSILNLNRNGFRTA